MSAEKARDERARRLATARGDLQTARVLLAARRWAHVCFHAQQAAAKAMKALWFGCELDPWEHSVLKLVEDLAEADEHAHATVADLKETAAHLDRLYVPTRYPNGLPDLTPEDVFFESDAARAIELADAFVERVTDAQP